MWTYGYGGPTDADHRARMEAIAATLSPESAAWYLKSTLARWPRRLGIGEAAPVIVSSPPTGLSTLGVQAWLQATYGPVS